MLASSLATHTHARTAPPPEREPTGHQALARQGAGRDEGHRPGEVPETEEPQRREAAHQRQRADHHHLRAAEGQGQRHARSLSRPAAGTHILAIEHEGTQICEWLQLARRHGGAAQVSRAASATCRRPTTSPMIQDAQRAVSLTRSMASELGIDPNRIGMLGFSAGGNLTAWTCGVTKKRCTSRSTRQTKHPSRPELRHSRLPRRSHRQRAGKLKPEFHVNEANAADVLRPRHQRLQRE